MSRAERSIYAVWFTALLLAAAVFGLAGYRPKHVASGFNLPKPDFESDRLLDDSYYRSVDAYVADWLPLRGIGQWTRARIDYSLLGDSTNPQLIAGSENWLFSTAYVYLDCQGFTTNRPFEDFKLRRDQAVYLVAEGKASFYADKIPSYQQADPCVEEGRLARRETISKDPLGLEINNQLQTMSPDTETFFRTDPHWTPQARLRVAQRIVDRFAPDTFDRTDVEPIESEFRGGQLRLMGLDTVAVIPDLAPNLEGVEVLTETRTGFDQLVIQQTSHSNRPDAIPGETLIIGDSQLAWTLPYLTPYFEDLTFVSWISVDFGKAGFPEIESTDRLIVQSIESSWPDRLAKPVVAELASKLTP